MTDKQVTALMAMFYYVKNNSTPKEALRKAMDVFTEVEEFYAEYELKDE